MRQVALPDGVEMTRRSLGIQYPSQVATSSVYTLSDTVLNFNEGRLQGSMTFQKLEYGRDDVKIREVRRFLTDLDGGENYFEAPIDFADTTPTPSDTWQYVASAPDGILVQGTVPSEYVGTTEGLPIGSTFIRDPVTNRTGMVTGCTVHAAWTTGRGYMTIQTTPMIRDIPSGGTNDLQFVKTVRARVTTSSKDFLMNRTPSVLNNITVDWVEVLS